MKCSAMHKTIAISGLDGDDSWEKTENGRDVTRAIVQ